MENRAGLRWIVDNRTGYGRLWKDGEVTAGGNISVSLGLTYGRLVSEWQVGGDDDAMSKTGFQGLMRSDLSSCGG